MATTKPIRERDVEAHLVKRVKELGGEVRKVRWLGRTGAPDRLVMLPRPSSNWAYGCDYSPVIWVEVKAPGKVPEPHQYREHTRMRRMRQRVEVVDSFLSVDLMLEVA